jgi:hypothetical protein
MEFNGFRCAASDTPDRSIEHDFDLKSRMRLGYIQTTLVESRSVADNPSIERLIIECLSNLYWQASTPYD